MTVYVDDMRARFGRMTMCHMIADSDDELHAMADRIGAKRAWHQAPPDHDSHYDISLSRRAIALAAGAVEVTQRQCAAMSAYRRMTSLPLPKPHMAEAMFSNFIKAKSQLGRGVSAGIDRR